MGKLGHLDHQFPYEKKDRYKKKTRTRKMIQVMMVTKKRRNTSHTRRMARRSNFIRMIRLIFLVVGVGAGHMGYPARKGEELV